MVDDESRPMSPEFDPFPMDVPDNDPSPPILVGYVEGEEGTVSCSSLQHAADVFRDPVYSPREWPAGTVVESVMVVRPGSAEANCDRHYIVTARTPTATAPILVHGYFGTSPYQADRNGCFAPPELRDVDGVVFAGPGSVSVSLGYGGLCVLLMNLPSVSEAIAAATSMERFSPAEEGEARSWPGAGSRP